MSPNWHAGSLLQLAGSYWQTFTLHAGVKLRLFTILSDAPLTAAEVASKIEAPTRSIVTLLNALCAMNLLGKDKDRFTLVDASRRFLAEDSPDYIGHMILHHHHLSGSWARLDEAVRTGKPLRTSASFEEPEKREAFLMGMFNNAMLIAPAVAKAVDLGDRRRLLDLAGGPGTYAIHFCLQNQSLHAVVADLPTTCPFAERTIDRFGLSQRIRFSPVDVLEDHLEGSYDVIWLSHLLHAMGPEECKQVIAKATEVLEPGGKILIHEFILSDSMDAPLFPALFSLNMLIGTEQGRSYSESQLRAMLMEAGMDQIRREAYHGPTESGIISGIRK